MVGARKQYGDIKDMRDRGPKEFKSHMPDRKGFNSHGPNKEGSVMLVAEKDVVTTHPLNSIKNVAWLMKKHDFRRVPITDPGTNRLLGLAVAIDILDFLGGGEKYNIIKNDYNGNFLAAINCPIQKIMVDASCVDKKASVDDIIGIILSRHTSAIPIVDDKENKKVIALVTERDVLPVAEEFGVKIKDAMHKKCITSTPGMMISDVSKVMVRNRLRRLPVIQEDHLVGVITVFDILGFLGRGNFKGIDAEENLSKRVEEIMEKDVILVTPDQDLAEVSRLVKKTNYGGFPVVEDDKLLGIVTTTDVLRWVYR